MMASQNQDPLRMVKDPYAGDQFVFPETECTDERRLFFKRMNEIHTFIYITKLSYDECRKNYNNLIPKLPLKENTPIKIEIRGCRSIMIPANRIMKLTTEGVDILTRQAFVMFYGSFETFLFQLFERSYPHISIEKDLIDTSLDILMKKKWDGKFSKMSNIFGLGYKAGDLSAHFSGFEMSFEGKQHNNPLSFLDELAQIRHRIVHASSILEKGKLVFIDLKKFHELFAFFFLLTGYVDNLFSNRFNFLRIKVNPAEA